jgi:hypothetical protein
MNGKTINFLIFRFTRQDIHQCRTSGRNQGGDEPPVDDDREVDQG